MFFKYPGKLFIIGEFAIMEKNSISVVSAVNAYMHFDIQDHYQFEINSSHGSLIGDEIFTEETVMPHIYHSIQVLKDFISLKPFKMDIRSFLEKDHIKYGFGSSGVVIVGTLNTILRFHKMELQREVLFKLAVLVQKRMNQFSSGGDLASAIFGGVIEYHSYDREWLKTQEGSLTDLITSNWPGLKIIPLEFSKHYHLEIGWTGLPHKTETSLDAVHQYKESKEYISWVRDANLISQAFIDGIRNNEVNISNQAIRDYRQHMLLLETITGIVIETKTLNTLIESVPFPAKVSGSGGGDCGIVLKPKMESFNFNAVWDDAGIIHLDYKEEY